MDSPPRWRSAHHPFLLLQDWTDLMYINMYGCIRYGWGSVYVGPTMETPDNEQYWCSQVRAEPPTRNLLPSAEPPATRYRVRSHSRPVVRGGTTRGEARVANNQPSPRRRPLD